MLEDLMKRFPEGSLVRFRISPKVYKTWTYGVVTDYKILITKAGVEEFVICKLRSHKGASRKVHADKLEAVEWRS